MIILYLTGVNRNVFAYLLLRRRTRIHTMTLFILKRYHRMKEDFFFHLVQIIAIYVTADSNPRSTSASSLS